MADPYVYPGTDVLINKESIRDQDELDAFERTMTLQRMSERLPKTELSAAGYREIHRHLFQDVYDWAGQDRTVNITKNGDTFCLVPHIAAQIEQRFVAIRAENGLKGLTREEFSARAAEHICEINAIHPFREGNGRTQRAFLAHLAEQAGHHVQLQRVDPHAWNEASIGSFREGNYNVMRQVIMDTLAERGAEQARPTGRLRGRGGRGR
jgi:cell filamentation protein